MKKYLLIPVALIAGLVICLSCKQKHPLSAGNNPPEITVFTHQDTIKAASQATILLEAIDPDRDTIKVTITLLNGTIAWTSQAQTIEDITKLRWEGTYKPDTVGNTTLKICVSDGIEAKTYTYPIAVLLNIHPRAQYTCSLLTQTAPYIVQLDATPSYDPDGEIVSWFWDLGDSTTDQGQKITHQYPDAQAYNITLIVQDDEGLTDTTTGQLAVTNHKPTPVIYAPIVEAVAPCNLWFDGRDSRDDDGTIISWAWNWNDQSEDSHKDADWHTFDHRGQYTVTLKVIDNAHADSSATITITVNPSPPHAAIEADSTSGYAPLPITFHGGGSRDPDGTIQNYAWSVSDAEKKLSHHRTRAHRRLSLSGSPRLLKADSTYTHTFTQVGTYTTTLIVEDNESPALSDTATVDIEVLNHPPVAKIHADEDSGSLPFTTRFYADSSYDLDGGETAALTYKWTFTDGHEHNGISCEHTFESVGWHNAHLVVTDPHTAVGTADHRVRVLGANQPPVAALQLLGSTSPHTDDSCTFSGGQSYDPDGDIINWRWEMRYPDAHVEVLPSQDSLQVYDWQYVGMHRIKLQIEDNDQEKDSTAMVITVQNYNPTAVITVTEIDSSNPNSVEYTFRADASTDRDPHDSLTYEWVSTDGGAGTDIEFARTFERGAYVVTLHATDPHNGKGIANYTVDLAGNSPPVAIMGHEGLVSAYAPFNVTFYDDSSFDPDGQIVNYHWWRASETKTHQDPFRLAAAHSAKDSSSHEYYFYFVGYDTVFMEVFDNKGLSDTAYQPVHVKNHLPEAGISSTTPHNVHIGNPLQFFDASFDVDVGDFVDAWEWRFGDDSTSAIQNPSHTYAQLGNYTVWLDVWDNHGDKCWEPAEHQVEVCNNPPIAEITMVDTLNQALRVDFDSRTNPDPDGDPVTYTWSINAAGDIDQQGDPAQRQWWCTFRSDLTYPRQYWAYLHVADDWAEARDSVRFTINCAVKAYITVSPGTDAPHPFNVVLFSANSQGPITQWRWDFDNNGTTDATWKTAYHTYPCGTHTCELFVSGPGAQDSTTVTIRSTNEPPVARFTYRAQMSLPCTVWFDGTASSDPNEDTLTYAWEFKDETGWHGGGDLPEQWFVWSRWGEWAARLTVRDHCGGACGLTDTHSETITLRNKAPFVPGPPSLSPDQADAYQTVTCYAQLRDPEANDVACRFTWGDGDTSDWTPFVADGMAGFSWHAYLSGPANYHTYYLTAQAKDIYDSISTWSGPSPIQVAGFPHTVSATIVPLPAWANGIAPLPNGQYVYVASSGGICVSAVETSTNTVVATIPTQYAPYDIAALPSGDYIYVSCHGNNSVALIRTFDNILVTHIGVGNYPRSVTALPGGEYVYVANGASATVSVIRTFDNTVTATIPLGRNPEDIVSSPTGDRVYVTESYGGNSVFVIRTSDNTVVATIPVGASPIGIEASSSGEYLYVANYSDHTISVIETSTNTVVSTISAGAYPYDVALSPNGRFLYVTNAQHSTVSVIRLASNAVVQTISVGGTPYAIKAVPNGNYVYLGNNNYELSILEY